MSPGREPTSQLARCYQPDPEYRVDYELSAIASAIASAVGGRRRGWRDGTGSQFRDTTTVRAFCVPAVADGAQEGPGRQQLSMVSSFLK